MDPRGSRVTTLTARVNITDGPTKSSLSSGAEVASRQLSPCAMEIVIGGSKKSLVYPLPVIGSRSKLRIARKSSYVEVVAPVAGPLQPGGFALNRFPVLLTDKVEAPWNLHRLQLDRLPLLDVSNPSRVGWIASHLGVAFTDRECALRERSDRADALTNIKSTIQGMLNTLTDTHNPPHVFGLGAEWCLDTVIFVPALRFDLASHTLVADAYVLSLTPSRRHRIWRTLVAIMDKLTRIEPWGDEHVNWKRLLPALAERCRTWEHGPNCEYLEKKSIPLSLELGEDPLCSCGQGKDVSTAFIQEKDWESAIPFVTRIAIGPLFGVPHIESVGRSVDGAKREMDKGRKEAIKNLKCACCGGQRKPKLHVCSACKNARYCSVECQGEDWKKRKEFCRTAREPHSD